VTTEQETVVDGLVNAAKYSVSVSVFVADYEVTRDKHGNTIINEICPILYYFLNIVRVEGLPTFLSVFSSPLSPTMLESGEVNY
jgi:hypothetical protein